MTNSLNLGSAICPACESSGIVTIHCILCDGKNVADFAEAIEWRIRNEDDAALAFSEWLSALIRHGMTDATHAVARTMWDGYGATEFLAMMADVTKEFEKIRAGRKAVADRVAEAKP